MKVKVVSTVCRRCGRPIATLNKSLYGCEELKSRLDKICNNCITVDETQEILTGQARAILESH